MKKIRLFSLILIFCLAVSCMPVPVFAQTNEIFVSPSGSDTAAGTVDAPLATLAGAKERAKSCSGPVTVTFREGVYPFYETVRFNAADKSGVTYRSYPGERVVFTAGKPISGFTEATVNGVRAFRKDVGAADFNVLFNEETTLSRPRWPETGYLYVKSTSKTDILNPEAEHFHQAYRGMFADAKDIPEFRNQNDVVIRILHYWKDEMLTIKSYDPGDGHLLFSRPTSMEMRENDRFFFENVFEALDAPGEWYLDKSEGVLWYIPFEGELPDTLTLWGSDVETMIDVRDVNGISFENIVFRGNGFNIPGNNSQRDLSSQAAYDATPCVSYENAADFSVKGCEFRDIAACALFFGPGVQNAAVEACLFDNLGAQAVFVRGENVPVDDPAVTKNIRIFNNAVSRFGRIFYNAVGILIIHANSVDVSHNEIHDGYYTAISCGWVWGYGYNVTYNNRICDNLIYNIGQGWLSDMGGIYMLGVQPGTVLSGNVIHNVAADPGEGGYGGWGIYLDEGSSKMTVEKNLVFACGSDSYHLHYGADNVIRNNIFALSAESQMRVVSRFEDHNTATVTNNIFLTDGKTPVLSHITSPVAVTVQDNLFWDLSDGRDVFFLKDGDGNRAMSADTAARKKLIGRNQIADPLFADPLHFDFTLEENSPAVLNGFEVWDYAEAGTVKGSVIGHDHPGGETAYGEHAQPQQMQGSREFLPFLNRILNRFRAVYLSFLRFFGVESRVC